MPYALYDAMKRRVDSAFVQLRSQGITAHQNFKANPQAALLHLLNVTNVVFYSNDEHQRMRNDGRVTVCIKGIDVNTVAAVFRCCQLHVREGRQEDRSRWSCILVQNEPFPVEEEQPQQPRVNWQITEEYEGRMYLH